MLYIDTGMCVFCSAPLERTKLLLRSSGEAPPASRTIFGTFGRTVREQGLASLWRGNLANVRRYAPLQALNFGLFSSYQQAVAKSSPNHSSVRDLSLATQCVGGAVAGATSLVVAYPIDHARTQIMQLRYAGHYGADGKSIPTPEHLNGSVFRYLKHEASQPGGFSKLYRHFTVTATGVAVYRALYFGLYERFRFDPITRTTNWSLRARTEFLAPTTTDAETSKKTRGAVMGFVTNMAVAIGATYAAALVSVRLSVELRESVCVDCFV